MSTEYSGPARGPQAWMRTVKCRYHFSDKGCWRGQYCYYAHEDVPEASTSKLPCDPSTIEPATETTEEDQPCCSVCLEPPGQFGLLENCNHVFCLSCIRSWRNPKDKTSSQIDSGVLYQCPNCRTYSGFILPSREFLQGDEKNIAEVIYKSKLSKIPCKHLQQSHDSDPDNLWCPFGKSCFYQHNHPETGDKVDFAHTHEESLQRMKQSRERRRMREEWMSGDLALESILRRMVAGHYHDWDDVEADLRREYESDEFDDEEEDEWADEDGLDEDDFDEDDIETELHEANMMRLLRRFEAAGDGDEIDPLESMTPEEMAEFEEEMGHAEGYCGCMYEDMDDDVPNSEDDEV